LPHLRLRGRRLFIAAGVLALVLAASAASPLAIVRTVAVLTLLALPLALSIAALLDAASRPEWVWALAQRRRVVWMLAIMACAVVLPVGLVVATWYLTKVRAELRATERGALRER
jgi:hypothetical protein